MNIGKNLILWVVIAVLLVGLFNYTTSSGSRTPQQQRSYSEFLADVQAGHVREVVIQGNDITVTTAAGRVSGRKPSDWG